MTTKREVVSCNLCGSRSYESVYLAVPDRRHGLGSGFDVLKCTVCGLVQTNPRPTAAAMPEFYPDTYTAYTSPPLSTRSTLRSALAKATRAPYTLRWNRYDQTKAPAPWGSRRVLDIGAGVGTDLKRLASVGWEPWGIERSPAAAEIARRSLRLWPERILVSAAEDASFRQGFFDLIVMSHVIEHLHDPRGVLARVHHWLSPGGRLIIRCPNVNSLERRVFGHLWTGLDVPRHLYHFSDRTVRHALAVTGFRPIVVRPEYQTYSLRGSISHLCEAKLNRSVGEATSRALHYGCLPLLSVLLALGYSPCLEVVAIPVSSIGPKGSGAAPWCHKASVSFSSTREDHSACGQRLLPSAASSRRA